jgi:hypothetical protein
MNTRGRTISFAMVLAVSVLTASGCSPIETPYPTPDIEAAVETAVADAVASQPTQDISATVEAAVAATRAAQVDVPTHVPSTVTPSIPTPTNAALPTKTPVPLNPPTSPAIELLPSKFTVQGAGAGVQGGEEFYLETRFGGVSEPELLLQDGVDLTGYSLEITFQDAQKEVQLFFKDREFNSVYSFRIWSTDEPMCFDPVADPCEVCQLKPEDFAHIYGVGAKVWGGVEGVEIASARLVPGGCPQ